MATKIDYAAVLADLEDRKDYLNDAIHAIKHLALAQESEPKVKLGRPPKSTPVVPSNPGKHVPRPGDLDYPDSENTSGEANE